MTAQERKYTIPLRRKYVDAPKYKRAKKAIKTVKEFISKHMKTEDVRIGKNLNEYIWRHGIKNPPGKVSVNAVQQEGYISVELEGYKYQVEKVQTEATPEQQGGLKGKLQSAVGDLKGDDKESEESEKPAEESSKAEEEKPKDESEDKDKSKKEDENTKQSQSKDSKGSKEKSSEKSSKE